MRKMVLLGACILSMNGSAQCVDEARYGDDLRTNIRSLFAAPRERRVVASRDLTKERVSRNESVIYYEQLSEDRIFDRPRPVQRGPCPDRIIRLYQVLDLDEYNKCNGIIRSDARAYMHDVLYRNCVRRRS